MSQEEKSAEKSASKAKDPYDFPSIFITMGVAMILWYGINLLAERLNITLSISDFFASEALGVLLIFLLIGTLVTLFLLFPVYVSRELILRWTGKKLRILRVFFVLFFSLVLTTFFFALLSGLFDLGSLEITDKESGGPVEVMVMIFYYALSALLAAFWLWKRPDVGANQKHNKTKKKERE